MSLSTEELLHLAKLARLRIDDDKLESLHGQLEPILEYVGRLQSVQVPEQGVERAATEAVVRPDAPLQSSPELLQALQTMFPDRVDGLLRVPGVFEKPKD